MVLKCKLAVIYCFFRSGSSTTTDNLYLELSEICFVKITHLKKVKNLYFLSLLLGFCLGNSFNLKLWHWQIRRCFQNTRLLCFAVFVNILWGKYTCKWWNQLLLCLCISDNCYYKHIILLRSYYLLVGLLKAQYIYIYIYIY